MVIIHLVSVLFICTIIFEHSIAAMNPTEGALSILKKFQQPNVPVADIVGLIKQQQKKSEYRLQRKCLLCNNLYDDGAVFKRHLQCAHGIYLNSFVQTKNGYHCFDTECPYIRETQIEILHHFYTTHTNVAPSQSISENDLTANIEKTLQSLKKTNIRINSQTPCTVTNSQHTLSADQHNVNRYVPYGIHRICCVNNCNGTYMDRGIFNHLSRAHNISFNKIVKTSNGFQCPVTECSVTFADKDLVRSHFFETHTKIRTTEKKPEVDAAQKNVSNSILQLTTPENDTIDDEDLETFLNTFDYDIAW